MAQASKCLSFQSHPIDDLRAASELREEDLGDKSSTELEMFDEKHLTHATRTQTAKRTVGRSGKDVPLPGLRIGLARGPIGH